MSIALAAFCKSRPIIPMQDGREVQCQCRYFPADQCAEDAAREKPAYGAPKNIVS